MKPISPLVEVKKARSEGTINPVLLELNRQLQGQKGQHCQKSG
jgi:hypothetical protein